MNTRKKTLLLFIMAALIFVPTASVAAKGLADGKVVIGGTYTLESGQTLNGDLFVMGGEATIEAGATVNGAAVVMGGQLTVEGEVTGEIVIMGGFVYLGEEAVVDGDLVTIGASLDSEEGAVVNGEIFSTATHSNNGIHIDAPFPPVVNFPDFGFHFQPLWQLSSIFGWALIMGLLAMLVTVFLAEPTQRVAQAGITQPLVAGGLGLLTFIVLPMAVVIMVITLILIPVAVLAVLFVVIAAFYGWIALGTEVGLRIMRMSSGEWALPLAAGLGTFIITLLADSINRFVPCIGFLVPALIIVVGLGAVMMSRFGTQVVTPPAVSKTPALPVEVQEDKPEPAPKKRTPRKVAKKE